MPVVADRLDNISFNFRNRFSANPIFFQCALIQKLDKLPPAYFAPSHFCEEDF